MREVDAKAIGMGIPSLVLMENAGLRVVEVLAERYAPLKKHRIVVFCGKGNNGGDGLVVARQLATRFHPESLAVVLACAEEQLTGDAAIQLKHWKAIGGTVSLEVSAAMHAATLIVDALLGTGLDGPPHGSAAALIDEINDGFPAAGVVAVDVPSGIGFDGVWAETTVTFEAPKIEHYSPRGAAMTGELIVAPIGIPARLLDDPGYWLHVSSPSDFRGLFEPRARQSHKGDFGHVLVVGGSTGTTGAAAMAGLAALRAGAGLVTVSAATQQGFPPELMTAPLSDEALRGKTVLALGPGLGATADSTALVRHLAITAKVPLILDADALNVLGETPITGCTITPHPGEMSRLTGLPTAQIQSDRVAIARRFATSRGATVVLKGQNTVVAFPDGRVWLNTTGGPAMATGGSGDILTGLIAGLTAQFPSQPDEAVLAAVWLHGRAGDLGAAELGEKSLIATDLLHYLPKAMQEIP
jgi:NAD(P)H-hydrate epimerase